MPTDRGADKGRLRIVNAVIPNWVPAATVSSSSPFSQVGPDTLANASDTFERQLMVAGLTEPVRVTYGTDMIGAQLTRCITLPTGELLAICIWGRGPISAINSITVDDAAPASGVTFTHYLGTASQTVNADLVTAFAALGITHTATLAGIAYSVGKFPVGSSIGVIKASLDGRFLYDQRNGSHVLGTPSTWSFASVPGLALANLIADTTYGLGGTISDWTKVSDVANANDALVSGEKKRIIGITLDRRLPANQWIDILRAHAGAYVVRDGSAYTFVADAASASVSTFGVNDIVEGSVTWNIAGIGEQANVVECAYTNTGTTPWSTAYARYPSNGQPAVSGEALRLTRLEMPGVQRFSQAERECIEYLNHNRLEQLTVTYELFAGGVAVEPGKVYTLNDGGLFAGLDGRVTRKTMLSPGHYRITQKKYDPAAFSSVANAAPSSGNTTLPSPNSPPTVTGLALSENIEPPGVGGTPSSSISASVTALTWPFLSGYVWYVCDDAGVLVDQETTVGPAWRTRALPAPQRYTVYCKARSTVAFAAGYASAQITLSGSTQSLTQLAIYPVLAAGAVFSGFTPYTLYPGDPNLRVTITTGISVASQYASTAISAAVSPDSFLNYGISGAVYISKNSYYVTTAPIDMGVSRDMTVRVNLLAAVPGVIAIQAGPTSTGPWSTKETTLAQITGRWLRLRLSVSDQPITQVLPDGTTAVSASPKPWLFEQDLGGATISVFGPTVEEADVVTTSASGPVTVTLAGTYAAQRDLQVTAIDGNGTAIVTANNVGPSPTAIHTFEINATVAGARVAVPVRWNFKGAV